jgi:hypothetical protein
VVSAERKKRLLQEIYPQEPTTPKTEDFKLWLPEYEELTLNQTLVCVDFEDLEEFYDSFED